MAFWPISWEKTQKWSTLSSAMTAQTRCVALASLATRTSLWFWWGTVPMSTNVRTREGRPWCGQSTAITPMWWTSCLRMVQTLISAITLVLTHLNSLQQLCITNPHLCYGSEQAWTHQKRNGRSFMMNLEDMLLTACTVKNLISSCSSTISTTTWSRLRGRFFMRKS